MRKEFDNELTDLNRLLKDMGELCANAIRQAANAIQTGDLTTAQLIIDSDSDVNESESAIESLCLKLLLEQQPVASDLRQISAALKMVTDLERIGDEAADIAEIIVSTHMTATDFPGIYRMSKICTEMVQDSIQAFGERDLILARNVQKRDDDVDDLFEQNRNALIEASRSGKEISATKAVDLIMIVKYLERIADHAVNVAEWVEFSITGVHNG